jgi:mannose-6-phosphate isomerase-like protein (cupin superfamily)
MPRFAIAHLETIPSVPCPCGTSRRAFGTPNHPNFSVHLVDISTDARVHYHKNLTETYVILEGEGWIEVDRVRVPVRPLTAVTILPGCRHRAIGKLKLLNFVVPAFDPADEHFD